MTEETSDSNTTNTNDHNELPCNEKSYLKLLIFTTGYILSNIGNAILYGNKCSGPDAVVPATIVFITASMLLKTVYMYPLIFIFNFFNCGIINSYFYVYLDAKFLWQTCSKYVSLSTAKDNYAYIGVMSNMIHLLTWKFFSKFGENDILKVVGYIILAVGYTMSLNIIQNQPDVYEERLSSERQLSLGLSNYGTLLFMIGFSKLTFKIFKFGKILTSLYDYILSPFKFVVSLGFLVINSNIYRCTNMYISAGYIVTMELLSLLILYLTDEDEYVKMLYVMVLGCIFMVYQPLRETLYIVTDKRSRHMYKCLYDIIPGSIFVIVSNYDIKILDNDVWLWISVGGLCMQCIGLLGGEYVNKRDTAYTMMNYVITENSFILTYV